MTEEHMEPQHHCESCGRPIYQGDMAQYCSDGVTLCEEHAATLSDIIRSWEFDLAEDGGIAGWPQFFDSEEEVRAMIRKWADRMAEEGDVKLLSKV